MKKFIVHSTKFIKGGKLRNGYFRDYAKFVETDDIEQYINNNFTFGLDEHSKKTTFCCAVEVAELTDSDSFKYIEKVGGVRIYNWDNGSLIRFDIDNSKELTRYDFKLKGWI